MDTHYQNCLQSMHRVIQYGVHEWQFKNGAFETKIAIKERIDDPKELLRELDILANSSATSLKEKRRFDKISSKVECLEGLDKGK